MKTTTLLKWALIALGFTYLAFSITTLFFNEEFFGFLESLSPDGNIGNRSQVTYTFNLYFLMMAAILFFVRAALSGSVKSPRFSDLPGYVKGFYGAAAVVILVNMFWHNNQFLHAEDGVQEYMTAVLALLTSGLCLVLTFRYKLWVRRLFWLGFAALLFFFGMEEISWGQRIVGWDTPEALMEINTQGESNLHNIFNEIFNLIYIIFSIVICTIVFYREWLINLLQKIPPFDALVVFIPPATFNYSGFLFMFLAVYTISFFDGGGETMEAVFSLFIFTYALDIYKRVKVNKTLPRQQASLA